MISIFARPSYIGNRYPRRMKEASALRLSSRIRGEEMAEALGAKLNPSGGFDKDVCIHVKHWNHLIKPGHWFDFLDGDNNLELLKTHPEVKVIAASLRSYQELQKHLTNQLKLIPHHHLNFHRLKRTRKGVTRAGYIGSPSPVAVRMYDQIGKALKEIGIELTTCFNFKTRDDAMNLYRDIDIFVIGAWELGDPGPFKMPTKIINAASFGIPTIAFPIMAYEEIEGHYLHAYNLEDMLVGAERLKIKSFYDDFVAQIIPMSENYHISKIAELYRELA